MTPDAVIRTWFREVWDEGREDAIDRLLADDAMCYGLTPEPFRGPQAFKDYVRATRAELGDLEIKILQTVTEGDRVTAHCHVVAREPAHAFGGRVPDRPVEFDGMVIVRVRDGRIVEGWNSFDFLSLYQQLGLVQPPAASV